MTRQSTTKKKNDEFSHEWVVPTTIENKRGVQSRLSNLSILDSNTRN